VDDVGVLKVRIVGADPAQRRRLAQILAAAPGNELAGVEPEPARARSRPALSPRERDVLETLKTHLRRLRGTYRNAGRAAPTRRDLYVRAVEDGLVPPPC
jgi:hypothetical protein